MASDPNAPAPETTLTSDDLYWEEVEAARQESFEDKLLAGPRLFERACSIMRDGIRKENPAVSEEEVERILLERLEIARRLEVWP
jgi:hypothetical protein